MAYVAARGGEQAIEQAERLYREQMGTITLARVKEIEAALPSLIDRVMGEASLYAPDLAALALAQSGGDLYEALLLLRAWRTTQPRITIAEPVRPGETFTHRRISASFKDIPGGQLLGPTLDYSHRLLEVDLFATGQFEPEKVEPAEKAAPAKQPMLADWLRSNQLIAEKTGTLLPLDDIPDVTREPMLFPADRALSLQTLSRADTGGVLALGYSAMRDLGNNAHPTVSELRLSESEVRVRHPDGTLFSAGRVKTSQVEVASKALKGPQLSIGFSATLGWNEVKIIAAATLDLNMDSAPANSPISEEFVISHTEAVESSGFCIHFKLPHYVTFQSSLDALRGSNKIKADAKTSASGDKQS